MQKKSLLFLLLMAMLAPLAMNGQTQNTVLSQNFDGNGFQIHLDEYAAGAWYAYNAGSGNNWILYEYSTNNHCAAYAYNSSYAANCYLVSEPFTVSSGMSELSVSLDECVAGSSFAETFEVFFVKASDVTTLAAVASATHYGAIASASYTNTTYAQVSGSSTSSALAGQSVRVVVHCTSAKDRYRLYIDDITVTETTSGGGGQGGGCDYSEDFEGVTGTSGYSTAGSLPTGWDYIWNYSTSPAYAAHVYSSSASTPGQPSTGNYLGFYASGSTSEYSYAIMPAVAAGEAANHISFKYKFESSSNGTLTYGVIDGTDASTYTILGTISNPSSNPGTVDAALNVSQTAGKRIAFRWYKTSTWYTCGIDDICVMTETTSACPAPTNLTATNLTPTSATLNWEGDAESYNVQYRKAQSIDPTAGFFDDFENGLGNWTLIVNAEGTGWQTYDATQFTDGSNYSGNYVAMARSYEYGQDITADNWMITSKFTSIPNTMTYWAKNDGRTDHQYDETYDVCVSTNTNSTSDFVIVQTFTTTPNQWEQITIDLSAYAGLEGYIAFHHHDAEKDMLLIDDVLIGSVNIIPAGEWIEATTTNNFIEITGLEEDADYEWQVQADCDEDGESNWTDIATFHTPSACSVSPTDLTAEVTGNAAELSWTGATETYNLQYCEIDPTAPATIILNVPSDIWNDGSGYQMLLDADATAYGDVFSATGGWTATNYSAFEYLIPTDAECSADATHFVFENSVSIQIPAGTYDWCIVNPSPGDKIYIAAQNGNVGGRQDDYVFEAGKTYEFVPSLYGQNDGVDVTITDNNEWTLVEGVNNPYTLENLSSQTTYEFQVQGADCNNWSASATFTTGEFYTKHIVGYGVDYDPETDANEHWYLISTPIGQVDPTNVSRLINTAGYDLYYFDQTQELEWITYKTGTGATHPEFNLVPGKGYLYANSETVDLVFTGAANTTTKSIDITYSTSNPDQNMYGWNLVGNPFAVDAYIGKPFYKMNSAGNGILGTEASGAIAPMEGVFVMASQNETLTFGTTAKGKSASLAMNLTKDASRGSCGIMDRAIVTFDESEALPKFQFRDGSTKVYIPMDGKDYAVVSAQRQGEMPVHFKAEENGRYTLSFNAEEIEFNYLHLIDNKTGNDVDLLANPNYSFDARTTDYASRFKLVFATSSENDDNDFAFCSNGSFVINNEGNATLQVIDVNGRILKSESINGCANVNVNAAAGVYMLRLINGDNVKTQKVVVK